MYQVRPEPPGSSDPSSATIASSGKAHRMADTITVSDARSASDTRSVWLDFESTPVATPSKLSSSCFAGGARGVDRDGHRLGHQWRYCDDASRPSTLGLTGE